MVTPIEAAGVSLADLNYGWCARSNASHTARCVACHGVPVALVGESHGVTVRRRIAR